MQIAKMTKHKWFLYSVGSAILCATSYPPFPAWALFFCFAPLWITLFEAPHLKRVLTASFICQFFVTLLGFYWVGHTIKVFGHIPVPLNILVLFGFCCIANLHIVLAAALGFYLNKKVKLAPIMFFISMALFQGFFEFLWPSIFPWNLGYGLLFSHFKTAQLAEFLGFGLLSFFVLFMNSLFALSIYLFPKKGWNKSLYIFIAVLFITETAGYVAVSRLPVEDKTVKILLGQTNIGSFDQAYYQYGARYADVLTDHMISMAEGWLKTEPKPDYIVWPENAFPAYLDVFAINGLNQRKLFEFIKKNKVNLITGGLSQDFYNSKKPVEYAALFSYNAEAVLTGMYRKNILLAFGEYIPGSQYLPFLKKMIPEIEGMGRGRGPATIQNFAFNFTPIICYEAIHDEFVAEGSNKGSHILMNITNDSWYGDFSEQWQHLTMSIARSVELRKPLVRVTNTGYSAVSDVRGNILIKSPLFQEWGKTVEVAFYSQPYQTVYSKIYKFIPYGLILLVAAWILGHIKFHGRRKRT